MQLVTPCYTGKKIAIVSNSYSELTSGVAIDGYDIIIRMNGGAANISGYEKMVGTRTDLITLNRWKLNGKHPFNTSMAFNEEVDRIYEIASQKDIPILFTCRRYNYKAERWIATFPTEVYDGLIEPIKTIGKIPEELYSIIQGKYHYTQPTAGIVTIMYLLLYHKPREIKLFNFNFNGSHYWDKNYRDMLVDLRYNIPNKHNANTEKDIISKLMDEYEIISYG